MLLESLAAFGLAVLVHELGRLVGGRRERQARRLWGGALACLLWALAAASLWISTAPPEPQALVGRVKADSPADKAGVLPGDLIVQLNGSPVVWWKEVAKAIGQAESTITLTVMRDGQHSTMTLERRKLPQGKGFRYEPAGLIQTFVGALIAVEDLGSPADEAGLGTWDRIVALDGVAVTSFSHLSRLIQARPDQELHLTIQRDVPGQGPTLMEVALKALPDGGGLHGLGFHRADTLVRSVRPQSPADKAGIHHGDRVVAMGSLGVQDWETVLHLLHGPDRPLSFTLRNPGGDIREINFFKAGQKGRHGLVEFDLGVTTGHQIVTALPVKHPHLAEHVLFSLPGTLWRGLTRGVRDALNRRVQPRLTAILQGGGLHGPGPWSLAALWLALLTLLPLPPSGMSRLIRHGQQRKGLQTSLRLRVLYWTPVLSLILWLGL